MRKRNPNPLRHKMVTGQSDVLLLLLYLADKDRKSTKVGKDFQTSSLIPEYRCEVTFCQHHNYCHNA